MFAKIRARLARSRRTGKPITVRYSAFEEITSRLESELRRPLRVIRNPRNEQKLLDLRITPSVVVYNEETSQMVLLEIGAAPADDADDVPFGTVIKLLHLKDWNAMLNPRVVLVSLAPISPSFELALAEHDIGVIRGRTCDDVMPALLDFIHAGSVAHR